MSTDATRSINEMRIDALSRIAEACMVHGLPAPSAVYAADYGWTFVEIRIDRNRPDQVDAWAEFLNLTTTTNDVYEDGAWIDHKAEATDHAGGLWLGFQSVEVWCAVSDPEQMTRLSALAVLGA